MRRQSWDEARCCAATRDRERRMSSCISDVEMHSSCCGDGNGLGNKPEMCF